MSNLSRSLRATLAADVPFSTLSLVTDSHARDGTVKALFRTAEGHPLEAVLMRYRDGRRSVCISSQSGCPLTCAEHALTPLEIIGEVIARRFGRSRVLVIGAPELGDAIARAGHEIVETKDYRRATVVVVGNDFDLTYERLTAAARAAAAGAPLVTPNVDPRLPLEGGEFLPGCGALVEAVAVAAGVRPFVVGKPEPPLFRIALERLGLEPAATAMVGDSIASDIQGARRLGMRTVLYTPDGTASAPEADLVVRSFAELVRAAGVAWTPPMTAPRPE